MPTINQGASLTVTIAAGMPIRVTTSGEAFVENLTLPTPLDNLNDSRRAQIYGPFPQSVQLRITAVSGAADYGGGYYESQNNGRVLSQQDPYAYNIKTAVELASINTALAQGLASYPFGYQLVVDGIGYTLQGIGTDATFAADGVGNSGGITILRGAVAVDGDSKSTFDPIIGTENSGGANVYGDTFSGATRYDYHWFQWMTAFFNGNLSADESRNHAQGGSTLAAIQARWDTPSGDPRQDDVDVLFLCPVGGNSINTTLTQVSDADILAQYEDLIAKAQASTLKLIVTSDLWVTSSVWSGYNRSGRSAWFSTRMKQICAKYSKCLYVEVLDVVRDPATGDARAGYVRDTDGNHPTVKLGKAVGFAVARAISAKYDFAEAYPTAINAAPAWTGTAGTKNVNGAVGLTTVVTGTVPTGYDVSVISGPASATGVTVTCSFSATTARMVIEVTNTSGTDIEVQVKMTNSVATPMSTGNKYFVKFPVDACGMVDILKTDVQLHRTGSAVLPINGLQRTNWAIDQLPFGGTIRGPIYTVATAPTGIRGAFIIRAAATTGKGTFGIGAPFVGHIAP